MTIINPSICDNSKKRDKTGILDRTTPSCLWCLLTCLSIAERLQEFKNLMFICQLHISMFSEIHAAKNKAKSKYYEGKGAHDAPYLHLYYPDLCLQKCTWHLQSEHECHLEQYSLFRKSWKVIDFKAVQYVK